MWIAFALASAAFAGLTSILAKIGVRHADSNLVTALRTVVVFVASWLMVLMVGSAGQLATVDATTIWFLVLSGLTTGASWLCYFRALQLADVNVVVPVDRSSVVMTGLFGMVLLGETDSLPTRLLGLAVLGFGTWLMVSRQLTGVVGARGRGWLAYAIASAGFASLTTILAKVGIVGVESNLGTAIRTSVVLVMAWLVAGVSGAIPGLPAMSRRDLWFIVLSGLATAASWLCFFRALQEGPASVVVPIDKLSILFTVAFSALVLGERLSRRASIGLILLVGGTLLLLV